jgi:cell division septal protein FtsQ
MINNLTKEDTKNSVEFRWRKSQLLWLLGILTIITVVMLLVLVLTSLDDLKYFM